MFRFYYVAANVRKRNIIKSIFSVSITSKVCFLFILIKQKHSAVSKKQLSVCCSWLGYQITKIQMEMQIYILLKIQLRSAIFSRDGSNKNGRYKYHPYKKPY
ncbi:hypothetical protein DXA29_16315 [Parabacteroides sp. OF01-14]|nr:hypothetical protein DXB14_18680 [Parabacteroides distasonis]RGZ23546.1 hypothetical protein DW998_12910 [Parabacteroides distasonis]RHD12567.1 hypothetical protein DW808_21875 [Parabacteroides distasonis]RKU63728.1 hypothetical protein DXA29_16315 [Parabacteroides sp. OF01-14]